MLSIINESGRRRMERRAGENRNRECNLHAHMYFLSLFFADEDKLKFH